MELQSDEAGVATAARIRTLAGAFGLFRRFSSPRAMVIGLTVAIVARLLLVEVVPTRWDLVAVLVVVGLVPFVEWFIHLFVLHAQPRTLGALLLDPGAGHRQHHLNPASIDWVVLRGVDAVLFQVINAGVVIVVVGGPLWLIGAPVGGPVLTGVVASVGALLHYEWAHFLFHTAYRPKTRYYRRLKSNHRLHHWRNERNWLGITTNAADRILGTYPASRSAVPLSPTARTLGVDPQDGR